MGLKRVFAWGGVTGYIRCDLNSHHDFVVEIVFVNSATVHVLNLEIPREKVKIGVACTRFCSVLAPEFFFSFSGKLLGSVENLDPIVEVRLGVLAFRFFGLA
ncbi:hypothetical protein Ahy_B03g063041 isoform A [Arachis hypogaea]|uniref:Uncharacterized protein n=1 Tax=Arachis hypogaea TaxID=3818 RepID=A0A444ZW81_ARAHY|nr:hypothetical protein Ahy_B03g063041 isoform A [Arachis hypogaea]